MSVPATVALRRQGAPDLLVGYAHALAALPIGPDARRIRRNAARRLLEIHPQLAAWMRRPTPARLADLNRTGAWQFVAWCFTEGHLVPDLDLLLAKNPGGLYRQWRARHPGDVQRVTEVAERFGWSANWTRDVSRGGLALICLTAGKTLDQLDDGDFAGFAQALAEAPSAGHHTWVHNSSRVFSLHQACYVAGFSRNRSTRSVIAVTRPGCDALPRAITICWARLNWSNVPPSSKRARASSGEPAFSRLRMSTCDARKSSCTVASVRSYRRRSSSRLHCFRCSSC